MYFYLKFESSKIKKKRNLQLWEYAKYHNKKVKNNLMNRDI